MSRMGESYWGERKYSIKESKGQKVVFTAIIVCVVITGD